MNKICLEQIYDTNENDRSILEPWESLSFVRFIYFQAAHLFVYLYTDGMSSALFYSI